MKHSALSKKFRHKLNFVQPLYRRVQFRNRVLPKSININIGSNLPGRGFHVKRNDGFIDKCVNVFNSDKEKCVREFHLDEVKVFKTDNVWHSNTMLSLKSTKKGEHSNNKENKYSHVKDQRIVCHKALMTWLQGYPAPKLPDESIMSLVFRCFMCQVGLGIFLIVWTLIWIFVIRYFEEPHELKVSNEFRKAQNQLVIDLATELRQVASVSSKWRELIEMRVDQERKLTTLAVGRGAKLHPGQYWDLPGTFLFTVFVMTTLGFGAPVPQTNWGRTITVVYGAFAVPAHVYFMVNVSTGLTYHVEHFTKKRKMKETQYNRQDIQSTSRKSDEKAIFSLKHKFKKCRSFLLAARGIPLAMATYYLIGAVSFGFLRGLPTVDSIMFPLEFTTSGGLEMVKGHVKVLYALYLEGGVFILACTLALLKFHSRDSIDEMIDTYRLFQMEACDECDDRASNYVSTSVQ